MRSGDEIRNSPTTHFTVITHPQAPNTAHIIFAGAHLATTWSSASKVANELHELISQLHQWGYTSVRTGAVPRTFLTQHQRSVVRGLLATLGIASQLVAQSMTWFARHQVKQVLVNTAVTNVNPHVLYQRCGFDEKSERLVVMEHRAHVAQRTEVC